MVLSLFSRSGFADQFAAMAGNSEERILLFTPEDLYW